MKRSSLSLIGFLIGALFAAAVSNAHEEPPPESFIDVPSPNPAHINTVIRYGVPNNEPLTSIDVFNVSGRRVRNLHMGLLDAGTYNISWSLRSDDGQKLPNGIYFICFTAGSFTKIRRIVVTH